MPKLLLAIPVLIDNKNRLTQTLELAFKQTAVINGDCDVYVIQNNPDDEGIVDQLENFEDCYLLINEQNMGVAGSWNQAIMEAYYNDYKYVSCMGFDVSLNDSKFLETSISYMEEGSIDFADTDKIAYNFWMCNAKSFKDKVGLYDENFYPGYWEDIDMIIRMRKARDAGYFNIGRFDNSDQVDHLQSKTIQDHESIIPYIVWNFTYTKNQLYLKKKWNIADNKAFLESELIPREVALAPFNNPKLHNSFWVLNREEYEAKKSRWDNCLKAQNAQ